MRSLMTLLYFGFGFETRPRVLASLTLVKLNAIEMFTGSAPPFILIGIVTYFDPPAHRHPRLMFHLRLTFIAVVLFSIDFGSDQLGTIGISFCSIFGHCLLY